MNEKKKKQCRKIQPSLLTRSTSKLKKTQKKLDRKTQRHPPYALSIPLRGLPAPRALERERRSAAGGQRPAEVEEEERGRGRRNFRCRRRPRRPRSRRPRLGRVGQRSLRLFAHAPAGADAVAARRRGWVLSPFRRRDRRRSGDCSGSAPPRRFSCDSASALSRSSSSGRGRALPPRTDRRPLPPAGGSHRGGGRGGRVPVREEEARERGRRRSAAGEEGEARER